MDETHILNQQYRYRKFDGAAQALAQPNQTAQVRDLRPRVRGQEEVAWPHVPALKLQAL